MTAHEMCICDDLGTMVVFDIDGEVAGLVPCEHCADVSGERNDLPQAQKREESTA